MSSHIIGGGYSSAMLSETLRNLMQQKDTLVLAQISSLVDQGILVIEETEPVIVQDLGMDITKLRLCQAVRLVSKEHEVIEKLRKENIELKNRLVLIQNTLKDKIVL